MHTATRAFGDRSLADEAVAALVSSGIAREHVRIDADGGGCLVVVATDDAAEAEQATRLLRDAGTPGPAARDPDVSHAPGLRYADQNEPNP